MSKGNRVIGHCTLVDQGPGKRRINVTLEECNGTLLIRPQGFGDYCSKQGHGTPVIMEIADGELQVVCYDNIDIESPSHIVNLEGATECVKICWICGKFCDATAAHVVDGRFIGDECCWASWTKQNTQQNTKQRS